MISNGQASDLIHMIVLVGLQGHPLSVFTWTRGSELLWGNDFTWGETEFNIRFVLPGEVMLDEAMLSPNITWPGKSSLMLDEFEFNKCFITPKHTLGSKQLQTGQCTCNNDIMSQFPCLQVFARQIDEVNHKTILRLTFKQLAACLGYSWLWKCTIHT